MANGFVRLTKTSNSGGAITLTTTGTSGAATLIGTTLNIPIYSGTNIYNSDGTLTAARTLTLSSYSLSIVGSTTSRFFANGNVGIGTTTDEGYKADINGTTRINNVLTTVGTTGSDTATLSAELTTTATGTNWSGSSLVNGYTHTEGSVAPLTSTLNAVVGTLYYIVYDIELDPDIGTGSISSITFGGQSIPIVYNVISAISFLATTTAALVVTPSSDFNGYVNFSIKSVTSSTASIINKRSDGTTVGEYRANTSTTNLFLGLSAGSNNYAGSYSTFIGSLAGQYNVAGNYNTFIGYLAGNKSIGNFNTFLGSYAGSTTTLGYENTFLGYQSGYFNTTGYQNVFVGVYSGRVNTSGYNNCYLGHQSGFNCTTGFANTFVGNNAGYTNNSGYQNTFIGQGSGRSIFSGINNTFLGYQSGYNNSTGGSNTLIGLNAGFSGTSNNSVVAVGLNAGYSNAVSFNTFVGTDAGFGNNNNLGVTYIGYRAGYANGSGGGANNTYVGYSIGTSQTSAYQNSILGFSAGLNITTVNNMVAIGYNAARYYGALNNNNQAGGNSGVYIGAGTSPLTNSTSNEIAIGYNTIGLGTNTVALGNDSVTLTALKGSVIIGATVVNAAAILQADSTTKGFLPPRMTTAQKNAISSPPSGLVIYDATLNKLCVRGASAWETITSA